MLVVCVIALGASAMGCAKVGYEHVIHVGATSKSSTYNTLRGDITLEWDVLDPNKKSGEKKFPNASINSGIEHKIHSDKGTRCHAEDPPSAVIRIKGIQGAEPVNSEPPSSDNPDGESDPIVVDVDNTNRPRKPKHKKKGRKTVSLYYYRMVANDVKILVQVTTRRCTLKKANRQAGNGGEEKGSEENGESEEDALEFRNNFRLMTNAPPAAVPIEPATP